MYQYNHADDYGMKSFTYIWKKLKVMFTICIWEYINEDMFYFSLRRSAFILLCSFGSPHLHFKSEQVPYTSCMDYSTTNLSFQKQRLASNWINSLVCTEVLIQHTSIVSQSPDLSQFIFFQSACHCLRTAKFGLKIYHKSLKKWY